MAQNREAPLASLLAETTAADDLFVRSHYPAPSRSATSSVTIVGEAGRPSAFTVEDLDGMPQRTVEAVLECAGNSRKRFGAIAPGEIGWGDGAVGCASWAGVPLLELLRAAGAGTGSKHLAFYGADRAEGSTSVGFARGLTIGPDGPVGDVLVATRLNGAPIPSAHGGPVRLVVPGWYGMSWVKWLERVVVLDAPFTGYFQNARYVFRAEGETVAPVERLRVKSLIASPESGSGLPKGRAVIVRGKAWSGGPTVDRVEVDAGAGWTAATLAPSRGPFAWRSWELRWTPTRSGEETLRVRAFDSAGGSQPSEPAPNEFQYGCHAIQAVRVTVE